MTNIKPNIHIYSDAILYVTLGQGYKIQGTHARDGT